MVQRFLFDTDDVFDVFIIGPMGEDDKGTDFEQRITRIKSGAEAALREILGSEDRFNVTSPYDLKGADITDDVFQQIDTADFAIADVSNRSPSVMYEMAFFHALGTPMVILEDGSAGKGKPAGTPFYFKNSRLLLVDQFQPDAIQEQLYAVWKDYFDGTMAIVLSQNPISKFYRVPLVDISAATGLAVGYYANFLQHVLQQKTGVLALKENPVDQLLVIRPGGVNTLKQDEDAIDAAFPDTTKGTLKALSHPRESLFFQRIHDALIIDIPTPIYTLEFAPRRRILRKQMHDAHHLDKKVTEAIMSKLENRMIDVFFNTLDFLVDDYNVINDPQIWQVQATDALDYPF